MHISDFLVHSLDTSALAQKNLDSTAQQDLLTIRADRDNYYYGCDTLFHVHPDLIHHLCNNATWLSKRRSRTIYDMPFLGGWTSTNNPAEKRMVWKPKGTSNWSDHQIIKQFFKHLQPMVRVRESSTVVWPVVGSWISRNCRLWSEWLTWVQTSIRCPEDLMFELFAIWI